MSAPNPVIGSHPCTAKLQPDPVFPGKGCQSSVISEPERFYIEPAPVGFGRSREDRAVKNTENTGCEEPRMEMSFRLTYLKAVCCCHGWTGSPPWSVDVTCYG